MFHIQVNIEYYYNNRTPHPKQKTKLILKRLNLEKKIVYIYSIPTLFYTDDEMLGALDYTRQDHLDNFRFLFISLYSTLFSFSFVHFAAKVMHSIQP